MIWITTLLSIPLLMSCSSSYSKPESAYIKNADSITDKVISKIQEETTLRSIGTGGGMMNGIRMLSISFRYNNNVDTQTARKLLLYCVNEYLTAINNDKQVRPYLDHYPFTPKGLEIMIYFYHSDGSKPPQGSLINASAVDGMFEYNCVSPNGNTLQSLYKETYEEALKNA